MKNLIGNMLAPITAELVKNSIHAGRVRPENVYQTANLKNRVMVQKIISQLLLPQSLLVNKTALIELGRLAKEGKSCLILMEHYSNLDIPTLYLMMERSGAETLEVSNQIISMAGMKLNEEATYVKAVTEAYSRIVIYPSRSIEPLYAQGEAMADEIARARAINRAALHAMVRKKHEGHIILVFPAGTRYRPGDESTRRGLREIDSYVKSFDHILFVGIAGNCLRINPQGAMLEDYPAEDAMVFYCDEQITESKVFRSGIDAQPLAAGEDAKQRVSDTVMKRLDQLHQKAERIRGGLIN
jgi:glycerol-3-phosphate O-acyltransferase